MAKEIPGFYFDEEKHKYFKVQPNYVAPKGYRYTTAVISAENKAILTRKADAAYKAQHQRSRIQHSRILEHPIAGSLNLRRELGTSSAAGPPDLYISWARGLEKGKVFYDQKNDSKEISQFIMDEKTGTIIYGESDPPRPESSLHAWTPKPLRGRQPINYTPVDYGFKAPINSLCISPSRWLLATTFDGSPSLFLVKLVDPNVFRSRMRDLKYHTTVAPVVDGQTIVRMDATSSTTYYACAANQFSMTPCFAIATPHGIDVMFQDLEARSSSSGFSWSSDGHDQNDFERCTSPYGISDTIAVDWLDQNVVLSGCRNGQVRLWDTRTIGTSIPLRHPSSITHARRLNENMIIVAGLKHQLHVYDLRFAKERTFGASTTPYTTFKSYRNHAHVFPSLGFDVHQHLVAAVIEDQTIQVYDCKTGEQLKVGPQSSSGPYASNVSCVRFSQGERRGEGGQNDGLRLLFSTKKTIGELCWRDFREEGQPGIHGD